MFNEHFAPKALTERQDVLLAYPLVAYAVHNLPDEVYAQSANGPFLHPGVDVHLSPRGGVEGLAGVGDGNVRASPLTPAEMSTVPAVPLG